MALTQPNYAQDLCYSAQEDRRLWASLICTEGAEQFSSLRVTESSPAGMSVAVSGGHLWVANDQGTNEGPYHIFNDAVETLTISGNSSGSTRTDLIAVQICDSQFAAVGSAATLVVIEGTPGAGAPAIPSDGCTYYVLATISVANGATSITGTPDSFGATEGQITDNRNLFITCNQDGFVSRVSQPASQTDFTATEATAVTLTATLKVGRRYRLTGYVFGQQVTATGFPSVKFKVGGADFSPAAYLGPLSTGLISLTAGTTASAAGSVDFAGDGNSNTFTLRIADNAGAFRVAANAAYLVLEDIGRA